VLADLVLAVCQELGVGGYLSSRQCPEVAGRAGVGCGAVVFRCAAGVRGAGRRGC
jgi:hypothetical protein